MAGDTGASLSNQHPISIALALCLVILYFVGKTLGTDAPDKLGLATGNTLIANAYVWNLATSSFFETHIVKLVVDLVLFLTIARGLSISSGMDQFLLYMVFSVLACSIGTSAYCFVRFFATGLEEMLMEPIYGFSGVFMVILMYARRQHKSAPIHDTVPQITYQNLPLLIILTQTLLRICGMTVYALDIPFTIIALLFSWSYLRFFYRYEENGPLGDKSDEFAFISMIPEALHVVAVPLTTAFYNLMAMFGIFPELEVTIERKPQHHLYQTVSKLSPDSPLIAPVRQDVVMERRRAKALKLLEMAEQSSTQDRNGWDLEEDGPLQTSSSTEFSSVKV